MPHTPKPAPKPAMLTTPKKRISRRTAGLIGSVSVGALAAAYFGCNPLALRTRTTPKKATERAPDFELQSQFGKTVSLRRLCQHRPVAIVFYRGFW